jgi:hypothetical protein
VHLPALALPFCLRILSTASLASQATASDHTWLWAALLGIGGSTIGGVSGGFFVLRAAGLQLGEARRAADAAEEQTRMQKQLREDSAQPYVWADIRPDNESGMLFHLVVGNSGPTVATDVHVQITPPLPSIEQLQDRADSAQEMIANGISSLPPGRTFVWPLGQTWNLLPEEGGRHPHTFTVTANGPFGAVPPLTYVIDLADYQGQQARPGSTYKLTKAIDELAKSVRSGNRE